VRTSFRHKGKFSTRGSTHVGTAALGCAVERSSTYSCRSL
jgi:hypothetical protein